MHLLILPPRYTPDTIAMSRAAAKQKWHVERLPNWHVPRELCGRGAAVYGEPLFVSVVAEPLGIEVLEPAADWLPNLPQGYRHRTVRLATLGEARQLTHAAFVKPTGDKCFPARVYASGAEMPPRSDLSDVEPVLISEPVRWELEFRAFVLNRRVETISPYLRNGQLVQQPDGSWPASDEETHAAEAFCQLVLSDKQLQCPPAFVLDVGVISGTGWAVIEANAAWGSGIYGCDPERVLPVIRRACIPKDQVQEADRSWLRR